MSIEIFLLILCVIVVIILFVFRKTTFVKKYWRYALVLIPAIFVLVAKILITIRSKDSNSSTTSQGQSVLKNDVITIKDRLQEVNTVVKVEAAAAKTNNEQLMKDLKEAQKIADDKERRKRLAEMVG